MPYISDARGKDCRLNEGECVCYLAAGDAELSLRRKEQSKADPRKKNIRDKGNVDAPQPGASMGKSWRAGEDGSLEYLGNDDQACHVRHF